MSSYKEHQNLIKKFKLQATKELPEARFFDRHVGMLYTKRGTPIKINKKGMADIYGIININKTAIHIEIEAKTGKSVQSKEQKQWQKFCENFSVYYFVMRSESEMINILRELIDNLKHN
jgi:putative protein kinase ArgK-like GTPase of G3E family